MKLRNKKTGEIIELKMLLTNEYVTDLEISTYGSHPLSLSMLSKEWEEYEEPKEYWYVSCDGCALKATTDEDAYNEKHISDHKSIGNYFETVEEAEKAVEKLKAWKRLKDKGFKVDLWDYDGGNYQERIRTGRILFRVKDYEENDKDLDLLFGGEECES